MKVNEIYISARDGFNMSVGKSPGSNEATLIIEYRGTEIVIESYFDLIGQAIGQAQEDIDFYKPGLKEAK